MINYESFKENVTRSFISYMPEAYADYEAIITPFSRCNQTFEGLTLRKQGIKSMPVINLNHLYSVYTEKGDLQSVLFEAAIDTCKSMCKRVGDNQFSMEGYYQLDKKSLSKVIMVLINTKWNAKILEEVPHRDFHDLSIVYKLVFKLDGNGVDSCYVRNDMLDSIGVKSEKQLYDIAMKNTRRMYPEAVKKMNDVLEEMLGVELEDADSEELYVISNKSGFNGAAVILYEDVLQNIANKLDDNLWLLPSSIHEMMALPAKGNEPSILKQHVSEVNETQVLECERLSNQIYFFDRKTGVISLVSEQVVSGKTSA